MTDHKSLFSALIKAQGEFPTLTKDATNPHFKSRYVSLERAVETIMPVLHRHGLTVIQTFMDCGSGVAGLRTILAHESGAMIEGVMPMPSVKGGPQEQASASTYARRYGLLSIVGIAPSDEDDDAERAERPSPKPTRVPTKADAQQAYNARIMANKPTSEKATQSVDAFDTLTAEQKTKLLAYLKGD